MKRASGDSGCWFALAWRRSPRSLLRRRSGARGERRRAAGSRAAEAAKYRTWLNQNCVGCHSNRVKQPADDPVNLESANVEDVLVSAATWERVLRKLAVRAMPPQGGKHPSEPEYVAFTTWLSTSLDRAWAGKGLTPGRFVVHRLNRTEYGNAIRDLLALDVNVDELLPSDGADFGFDNIATALKTSPLLLERYLTAAQRVSQFAVGDTTVPPGNTEYPISREFTQSGYIEGLPLGTRGGIVIRHVFPGRRRIQAVRTARARRRRRLRRRRRQRSAAHVRGHRRWRRGLLDADWRPEGQRSPGARHERGADDHRRAHGRQSARDGGRARSRLHVARAALRTPGRLAARASRQPGSPPDHRPAAAESGDGRRSVQGDRHQLDAEPREDFHLQTGRRRPTKRPARRGF